jgi:hypothetical protein
MIARAYSRCNSGHYFVGENCPFDGWFSEASRELTRAIAVLSHSGRKVSVEELRRAVVSEATVLRTIVVEFGSDDSAFDAISPKLYVVGERAMRVEDLDDNFR